MIEIPTEYLDITHAIVFAEACSDWDELREYMSKGMTLDFIIKTYVDTIDDTLNEGGSCKPEELRKVREQLQTKLFRTYLAAKLGMM